MKQYSFTIKAIICKYQHKCNDLQPILQPAKFRLYWIKKSEVRGEKNVTTCVAFQAGPAFVWFCSYQARVFPITSGMTVRQRGGLLLLSFFPVGFRTSRALQALTYPRITKAAKQLVLHSNAPELQRGNHVPGQVQYQDVLGYRLYNTALALGCGLGDNTIAGGFRLLKRRSDQSFLAQLQTISAKPPDSSVYRWVRAFTGSQVHLGQLKNLRPCFLKHSVNGSFQVLNKVEIKFSWLCCSRPQRSVLGEEEQFLSTSLREKSVGTNTDA